jgi:hypothetical protein
MPQAPADADGGELPGADNECLGDACDDAQSRAKQVTAVSGTPPGWGQDSTAAFVVVAILVGASVAGAAAIVRMRNRGR